MKTIIQVCSQHMKHKNTSKINMKNTIMIIKTWCIKTITKIHMINMTSTCELDL